jgi:hypothetical protein
VGLLFGSASAALAQTRPNDWCDIRTGERVVAVGDVHGAYQSFVAILRAAGLLDARERWSGGKAILIQTGDVVDRGPESRRVLDLLRRLERDAPRAGGRVLALLGNHELMRVLGDWRYVSEGEYKAFRTGESEQLREFVYQRSLSTAKARAVTTKEAFDERAYREQFIKEFPLGALEMRQAFDAKGEYGPWVRSRPTIAKVNGVAFMHGGVSEKSAALGCEGLNQAVSKELASLPIPPERVAALLSAAEDGPLWYRGLAQEPEEVFAPTLQGILERVGARAFVIGHTPVPGRIVARFGGRVVQVDGGMLAGEFFPKGTPLALEILGNQATAIHLDRREPVEAPALAASTSAR